jgi:hypothetical protein
MTMPAFYKREILRRSEMIKLEEPGRFRGEAEPGPICHHGETGIKKLYFSEIRSSLGRRYIYYCSTCLKVLGVSHRKGFWMG